MDEWRRRSEIDRDDSDDGPSYEIVVPPAAPEEKQEESRRDDDVPFAGLGVGSLPLDQDTWDAAANLPQELEGVSDELIKKIVSNPQLVEKVVAEQTQKLDKLNSEIQDIKSELKRRVVEDGGAEL